MMIEDPTNPPTKTELQNFLAANHISDGVFSNVVEDIEDRQRVKYIRDTNSITVEQWKAIITFCQRHGYPGADTYPLP